MSTIDIIDPANVKGKVSQIQASAITLMSSQTATTPSIKELYDLALEQTTLIETDVPMAAQKTLEMPNKNVLVNFTGGDISQAGWAKRIVPEEEGAQTLDYYNRLTREVSFELMQRDLIKTSVYFSKNVVQYL